MICHLRRNLRPACQRLHRATNGNNNFILTRQASVLSGNERDTALASLTSAGWTMVPNRDAIQKKYQFQDFVQAWGFMSR